MLTHSIRNRLSVFVGRAAGDDQAQFVFLPIQHVGGNRDAVGSPEGYATEGAVHIQFRHFLGVHSQLTVAVLARKAGRIDFSVVSVTCTNAPFQASAKSVTFSQS